MKALITGAAGFIGSTLARELTSAGSEVTGLDSLTHYYDPEIKRENISMLPRSRFSFVPQDINTADLASLLAGVDVVYHLAGQPGVRRSWGTQFDEYVSANVQATQRLLEAAVSMDDPPRVVYASSSSIYGDAETYPTDETTTPNPRSPYGVTKLAAEHLCRLYSANFGLPTISLRFFTVYGPRQRPDMAFTRFLTAATLGRPVHVYGTGEQIRDFTYVDDIVRGLIKAAHADIVPGAVYNVSGGGSHSVNEVLAAIEDLSGQPISVVREPSATGDVSRTTANIAAITRDLGWSPSTGLRDGLAAQLDWVRTRLAR